MLQNEENYNKDKFMNLNYVACYIVWPQVTQEFYPVLSS